MLGHLEATKNPRKILLFYAGFFGRILEPSWAYIVSSVGHFKAMLGSVGGFRA